MVICPKCPFSGERQDFSGRCPDCSHFPLIPRPLESAWQGEVIETAHAFGWRAVHFRPGRTLKGWQTPYEGDGKGYPDTHLSKPGRGIIYAELKVPPEEPTPEQLEYLDWLRRCGIPAYVWMPHQRSEIRAILSR